jgi:hypothetical protein
MKNHVWRRFWRLEIIDNWYTIWINSDRMCLCRCDCWVEKYVRLWPMRGWNTLSCWCIKKEMMIKKQKTHWLNWSRLHRIWAWIKTRCTNKKVATYKHYWERWITYDAKRETFEWFYQDMKEWYSDNLEIDRIDNNWNYSKENCRWVTHKENMQNYRKCNYITYKWKTLNLRQRSKEIWKYESTILRRIKAWQPLNVVLSKKKRAY